MALKEEITIERVLLTRDEAATYLLQTPRWMRGQMEERGELWRLSIKVGRQRCWLKRDLDAFIESCRERA